MKLCKDCKHFRESGHGKNMLRYCVAPALTVTESVMGHVLAAVPRDERMSEDSRACGPEGRFWEAKDGQ